jgi:hypothetical protein
MKRFPFLPLLALLALNACDDDDDPTGNDDVALVRIVNAAPEAANASVNVFEGTDQLVSGVGFQTASACSNLIELEPGQHTLAFRRPASATVDIETETFTFAANETYTVVLYNSGNNLDAFVLQDDQPATATAGNNMVRIINATNTAGDVYVTTPAGTVSGTADISNLAAGAATTSNTFRPFPTAETRFRLTGVGNTTVRGDRELQNVPSSRMTTVVFTEVSSGGGTVNAVQFNPC